MNRHQKAKAAGRCYDCAAPPLPGRSRCERHFLIASERSVRWRAANADRVKEHRRRSYEANKELVKERSRAWSKANRERKAALAVAWVQANPGKVLSIRLKRYGLDAEAYAAMLSEQKGGCAICGSKEPGGRGRFAVDHDHAAEANGQMVVRGLLCMSCNRGLGYFADDPQRLRAASDYLGRR